MNQNVDVHQVFADYFQDTLIKELAYQCSKKLEEGQIYLDFKEFLKTQEKKITQDDLLKSEWVGELSDENVAFVLHQNKIYLQRYFSYETETLTSIRSLIASEDISGRKKELIRLKDFVLQIFPETATKPDWQLIASLNAYLRNFSLITGGPGTGKTTTIAKLLAIVFKNRPEVKIALVAPTGKATARMKESLLLSKDRIGKLPQEIKDKFDSIHSSTIHRLLGYQRETHYFKHHKNNPLSYDWLIIDESSMIGISLFSKLLQATPKHCQLVLLGDKNQLSSVDAGSLFGDICKSNEQTMNFFSEESASFLKEFGQEIPFMEMSKPNLMQEHIVELRQNYRFDSSSNIGKLSKEILFGKIDVDTLHALSKNEVSFKSDFQIKDIEPFFQRFESYIESDNPTDAINNFKKFRILCPSRIGAMGVEDINLKVEAYLRAKGLIKTKNQYGFYEHQPIMIRYNDYQLQLFNGDIGIILRDDDGRLTSFFESEDGSLKKVNPYLLNHYETVFAMSIHKSQGSEFDALVMVIPESTNPNLLSKELIYTGITRAKKELNIFCNEQIFVNACQKNLKNATGMTDRIKN